MRSGLHILLVAASAVFALVGMTPPGPAQIIQIEPGAVVPQDGDSPDTTEPVRAEPRGRRPGPGRDAATSPVEERLVPLRLAEIRADTGGGAPRLTGEVAFERFILFLPSAPGATELRLSHRSSIDVLPEQSVMRVSVNGEPLGEIVPDNFSGFEEDRLAVPAGVLRAGRNLVEIEARHTHRVACGPDASFAVWTEMAAGQSGVAVPADAFAPDPMGFLSAVAAQSARGAPIVIRRADPSASLAAAAPFIAEVAGALGGTPPEIESAPFWTLLETPAPLVRVTVMPPGASADLPRFARGGDGALVLLLAEDTGFEAADRMFAGSNDAPGPAGPAVLTPGRPVPLSDLRPDRLVGEGRYFVLRAEFRLPSDWLMLTSAKARLDLDYRFPTGLPDGSLMLIKVNGTTVRMLPLDIEGGMFLPTLPVSYPARLMRPGVNRLDFEVLVPGDPVYRMCPPLPGPVVEISGQSRLLAPATPGMSLPSIDTAAAGLGPEAVQLTPSAEDRLPPGFEAQIAALLDPNRASGRPGTGDGRLTIGTVRDLDMIRPEALGGDVRALSEALTADTLPPEVPPEPVTATAWSVVDDSADGEAARLWGLGEIPRRAVGAIRRMALGTPETLDQWLDGRTAKAAMLQPDPDHPDDLWLIVGPRAEPARIARILAASLDGYDAPTGQVAIHSEEAGWESWVSPQRALRLHDTITLGNLREIMGTYATLAPLQLIAATLAVTVLSVLVAMGLLFTLRGRDR